jgi:hypothetical protein
VVRAELIEYASATPFEKDYSNLHSFTGTVTAYNENRDAISVGIFDSGDNGECPPPPSGEPGNPSPGGSDGTIIISPGSGEDPLNPSPWPNWPSGGASQDETISPGPKCGYWQFTYNSAGNPVSATNGCDTVIYRLSNIHSKLTPHCNDGSGVIILPGIKPKTPCELTKELMEDQDVQTSVKDLEDNLPASTTERGWKFMKDGTPPQQTTENTSHSVKIGDPSLLNGCYHTHPLAGVHMFSPQDIVTLISIARFQSSASISNAFSGLIASSGTHYVMRFTGSFSQIQALPYPYDVIKVSVWNVRAIKLKDTLLSDPTGQYGSEANNKLNSKGEQKLFFDMLEMMDLQNHITLQKIEKDTSDPNNIKNVVKEVNQNSDGTIAPLAECD